MRSFVVYVGPYISALKCTCTYLKLFASLCKKTILNRATLTYQALGNVERKISNRLQ